MGNAPNSYCSDSPYPYYDASPVSMTSCFRTYVPPYDQEESPREGREGEAPQ